MKIKVCGLREPGNIRKVAELGTDLLGFIFYRPSPRYAGDLLRPSALRDLPLNTLKTGVFVNASMNDIRQIVDEYQLDYIQLHGNETPSFCGDLDRWGIPVIRAFRLFPGFDFASLRPYIPVTRYFLFDTLTDKFGGSGRHFDWDMLGSYELEHPFLLSGGIGPGDAESVSFLRHPQLAGIDLNSRFEKQPGVKDISLLKNFMKEIRNT